MELNGDKCQMICAQCTKLSAFNSPSAKRYLPLTSFNSFKKSY